MQEISAYFAINRVLVSNRYAGVCKLVERAAIAASFVLIHPPPQPIETYVFKLISSY